MSALPKKAKKHIADQAQGWPLVVFLWMFGLGLVGYVGARIALDAFPHPYHWGAGLAGIVLGCVIGWGWFKTRGDVL